jgi:AraC family transcriptional regulator, chemosensory pili system protein ChpD
MLFRRRTISGLEIALLDCEGHSFAKHAHDEFVIGANLIGREHIWLDGKSLEAERDELTLYNPGQVQAGDARNAPWTFVSLYCDSEWVQAVLGLAREVCFEKPVVKSSYHAERLRSFGFEALAYRLDHNELVEASAAMIGDLFCAYSSTTKCSNTVADIRMAIIASQLIEECVDPPSLATLAATAEMSPVQLIRKFSRAYGLPPFQWLNCIRLQRARHELRHGAQIADVAFGLGFADQAHFTRRFKAMYGFNPGAYATMK